MKTTRLLLTLFLIFPAIAAEPVWHYELLEGSHLVDECLICGRPTVPVPMRGSFGLRQIEASPIATRYAIENVDFQAGGDYHFQGNGVYEVTGQLAVRQIVTLSGTLRTAAGARAISLTNESSAPITRVFPMLSFTLLETNGTLLSTISMTIAAAPLREIWFSTTTNFTRAIPHDKTVSSGDLVSTFGRVVMRNSEFQQHFPGPTFDDIGLDAIEILPGAGVLFSGHTRGVLNDGDFASVKTGLIRWDTFMRPVDGAFGSDPGLDALVDNPIAGFYYSVKTSAAGLEHGAIYISAAGTLGDLYRSNADLLAQFHPSDTNDYGLDALHIWQNREIWFSTSKSFFDTQLGEISHGDLLSDAGYIVFRNRDLVAPLSPAAETNDFGLDAVFIVSDAAVHSGATFITATPDAANKSVDLTWTGGGRVFQLERAPEVTGPWQAVTPIVPVTRWNDIGAFNAHERAFYRLRQW